MAAISRQQLIAKMHKVLKAEFKPVVPDVSRPILEQVLFACCLENASYDIAEKVFARLGEGYFDLNEVRVTTVAEIAETLHELPDPSRSSLVLRRVLQAVFESSYSFSLENTRKHTLVRAIKTLEKSSWNYTVCNIVRPFHWIGLALYSDRSRCSIGFACNWNYHTARLRQR